MNCVQPLAARQYSGNPDKLKYSSAVRHYFGVSRAIGRIKRDSALLALRRIAATFRKRRTQEDQMTQRIDYGKASPAAVKAMLGLQAAVDHSGLEPSLMELLKLRASQINGCAYCIDMHFKDAKALGETDERLYLLNAWREAPFYSARERAALLWCETLTLIAERGAPDEVFEEVRKEFSEDELVNLTLAIVAINCWNRFSIGFRAEAGNYDPASNQKLMKAIREKVRPGAS